MMEEILRYVKPELIVVALVLYLLGQGIKQSQTMKDKYIPLINGAAGIILCGIYIFAVSETDTLQKAAMAVFSAMTQGILVAGLSTYINQLIKQWGKPD